MIKYMFLCIKIEEHLETIKKTSIKEMECTKYYLGILLSEKEAGHLRKLFFSFATILLMSGCSMDNNSKESSDQTRDGLTQVNNSTIQESDRMTGQQTSKRLTDLAQSVPEVNDATAVVLGKYALVGRYRCGHRTLASRNR